ncbi:MAG: hypothetical protein AB7E05_13180 [Sphingobium sp.]
MTLLPILLLSVSITGAAPLGDDGLESLRPPLRERAMPPPPVAPAGQPVVLAQVIEQRVVIRVPMMRPAFPPPDMRAPPSRRDPPPSPMKWEERKGPKCIRLSQLRAASITTSHGVDLILRDNSRMRARLGRECRPEYLYSGFYIQPDEDGSLCAGRDRVLARGGANCLITDIRRLVPDK